MHKYRAPALQKMNKTFVIYIEHSLIYIYGSRQSIASIPEVP